MNDTEKLLPCPFCGGQSLRFGTSLKTFGTDIYIQCECGGRVQICEEYGYIELKKRWNTRLEEI
ncbi:MAG: Lar family restriction alleviation protein [Turicibacter sp.]|nr:Lar family restriction alleviation protein [Turicibacter sp.]